MNSEAAALVAKYKKLEQRDLRQYFLDDYQELFGQLKRRTFANPYDLHQELLFHQPRRQRFQTPTTTFNQQLSNSLDQQTQLCKPCQSQLASANHTNTRAKLIYYLNRFTCPESLESEADLRVCQLCGSPSSTDDRPVEQQPAGKQSVGNRPAGGQPVGKQQAVQQPAQSDYKRPWVRIADQITKQLRASEAEKQLASIQAATKQLEASDLEKHEIGGWPVRLVVAVDTSLVITDPNYDRLLPVKQRPNRPTKQELVLTQRRSVKLNNRWKPGEPIDHDAIRYWDSGPFDLDPLHLKRIKIYGLPYAPLHDLLHFLAELTDLVELEIDTVQQIEYRKSVYNFLSLELLSVDQVRLIDEKGNAAGLPPVDQWGDVDMKVPLERSIVIRAPKLAVVYFGLDTLDHFLLPDSKPFVLTTGLIPVDLANEQLQQLRVLVLNEFLFIADIERIVCGLVLPNLVQVHFNVPSVDANWVRENDHRIIDGLTDSAYLASVYKVLRSLVETARFYELPENRDKEHSPVIRSDLSVFIHGVKLQLDKEFAFYEFDKQPFRHRFTSELKRGLDVVPYEYVSSVEYSDLLKLFYDPKSVEIDLLSRFQQLHPYLRSVTAIDPVQTWQLDGLIPFLESCTCLIELKITQPKLVYHMFCERLAQLPSCRTLRLLELTVSWFAFEQQLELNFLSAFPYLRVFRSNLVTAATLPQLGGRMLLDCLYTFGGDDTDLPRFMQIRKVPKADGQCEFELYTEEELVIPFSKLDCETYQGTSRTTKKHKQSFDSFQAVVDYCLMYSLANSLSKHEFRESSSEEGRIIMEEVE